MNLAIKIGLAALAGMLLACQAGTALAESVRYELPELLGMHSWDLNSDLLGSSAHIDTPFGFYAIESARLVVEGTISPGLAHGDGVIREPTQFVLEPHAVAALNGPRSVIIVTTDPTPSVFHFDEIYSYPFVPETTPLPNPAGYPPVSFNVIFGIGPALSTQVSLPLGPHSDPMFWLDGVVVDVPIAANITEAYVILTGSAVPEPQGWLLLLIGGSVINTVLIRQRTSRKSSAPPRRRSFLR